MSKLQELKDAALSARKTRHTERATLLVTIIGEAAMIGKSAGNRESTDAEVLGVLKKFEKNINENIQIFKDRLMLDETVLALCELLIVQEFLPAKLTGEQVLQDIKFIVESNGLSYDQPNLGIVTSLLKAQYGDQFDGK